jgi:hypothetical protein
MIVSRSFLLMVTIATPDTLEPELTISYLIRAHQFFTLPGLARVMTNPPVLLQLLAQRLDGGGLLTTSETWEAGLKGVEEQRDWTACAGFESWSAEG